MGKTKILLTFFFIASIQLTYSQGKYAVHYKFKPQENFSLENAGEFLTTKSIDRRDRQGILLDSLDLPISNRYVEVVLQNCETLLYNSKWMNASVVVANQVQVDAISNLDFVEKVEFVAPVGNPGGRIFRGIKGGNTLNLKFRLKSKKEASEVYDFQNSLLGIQDMHGEGFTGAGILVAVFDAGFLGVDQVEGFRHLFDNNQILATKDLVDMANPNVFTKSQHGTNVLSLIAANSPERLVSGAPDADYILCITEDVPTEYRIEEYNWLRAAEFADSLGVDIINSSLGYLDFDDPTMDYYAENLDGKTALISQAAAISAQKGILVVTSVGNYGGRGESSLTAPADAEGVLSIGSVDSNSNRSPFSSQGPNALGKVKPELTTFGQSVYMIRSNGVVGTGNGTSFSSPQIAALAAGLWQAKPEWSKDKLIAELLKSGTQANNPDSQLGYGIPNFLRAYYGEVLSVDEKTENSVWKIYPNPHEGTELFVLFGNSLEANFRLYDVSGTLVSEQGIRRDSNQDPFKVNLPFVGKGLYMVEVQSEAIVKRTKLIKR
ncbi:S8 family serine peptidase [Belliella marina]|uniref:S8 family serine peptidase n=1 Tax=Belliella marina TaxID=1644146 RepID=A0ABW4VGG5_9BACT